MTAPKVNLDRSVTIGNLVSWLLIAMGFVAGYTKLQDAQAQTVKDVALAAATASEARTSALAIKDDTNKSISLLSKDIAVIKNTLENIDRNFTDWKQSQRKSNE